MKSLKTIIAVALTAFLPCLAGCDWFEDVNNPPTIRLSTGCPAWGDVLEGDDVTFGWTGSDFDGDAVTYEWSYDGSAWVATSADSTVIQQVAAGAHAFSVRARDSNGSTSAEPAECSFTVLPKGVARVVLVEMLTTNTCRNCPNAEEALNNMLTEMGADKLAVVAYHDKPLAGPNSDGLATDETDARVGWYTADPGYFPEQWPVAIFDGLRPLAGAETAEQATALYRFEIESRLDLVSPIQLALTGEVTPAGGNVTADVKLAGRLSGNPLALRFVVIEDDVSYNGYFAKIYDFVARDILDDYALSLAAIGDSVRVDRAFTIPAGWVTDNLDVIAFVQDTSTREVLQAARLRP